MVLNNYHFGLSICQRIHGNTVVPFQNKQTNSHDIAKLLLSFVIRISINITNNKCKLIHVFAGFVFDMDAVPS